MHAQVTNLVLRSSFDGLRSPKSFIRTIMLGRAIEKHASSNHFSNNKQSPLQSNPSAANTARPPTKRKFDRTMSSSSNLGSLHDHTSFDENRNDGIIDLTSPTREKGSDIEYPYLGDHLSYPSLPPLARGGNVPTSSAPVPWSSSPDSHFEKPPAVRPSSPRKKDHSAAEVRPAKKRTLPSSFSANQDLPEETPKWQKSHNKSSLVAGGLKQSASITGVVSTAHGRFDHFAALNQTSASTSTSREKNSSVMAQMLEKASAPRQRQPGPMSRASSDRSVKSMLAPDPLKSKVPETFLSDEQRSVVKAVMDEGKSVFFTGSAGTGKSVLMRAIIAQLRHKYRSEPDRVAVTASTGLASCILEGQTLHSWAGIGLGKEPAPELVKKVKRNMKSRQRWQRTKVLIIDEISMVDGQLFDKLEQVARTIRNNGRPFGGIQLVFTGDFFQLPPVPDRNTEAKFVFEASNWGTCIQHTILLTHVFRQKDEEFAKMLNEMRLGRMSPGTIRAFKSLSRPLNFHDDLEATELYPRRDEVENANQNRMRRLSGQTMTFAAIDTGVQDLNVRKNLLSNFIAPETLEIKKGAQVMLIKNIDPQLVNGSLGIVQSFMDEGTFFTYKEDEPTFLIAQDGGEDKDDIAAARDKIQAARMKANATGSTRCWPMVRFNLADGTSRDVLCTPDEWKTEAQNGEIIAKRTQVPLILAWALSIHKAQGQTLNRVKVDLGKVFEKGQAYVALSRATSKEGLQVLRFDERKVMVHQKVLHFYSKLRGHETLDARSVAATVAAVGNKGTSIMQKQVVKTQNVVEIDDDFDDDLSYEDMLAAETELLRATGRG